MQQIDKLIQTVTSYFSSLLCNVTAIDGLSCALRVMGGGNDGLMGIGALVTSGDLCVMNPNELSYDLSL